MKFLILSFLFSLSTNHHGVLAYPTGAGGCASGVAAVGGTHLTYNRTTGPLADGNFQVFLDDTTELAPNTTTMITPSQEYMIRIVASGDAFFEGALIRVDGTGTTLEPGLNAQTAMACTDAASGATHVNTTEKTEFTATFGTDGTENVIVDVTVVVVSSASEGSIYYYDQFVLQPEGATPAAAPSAAEPSTPVASPRRAPTSMPTSSSFAVMTTSFPARALLFTFTAVVIAIAV